MPWEFCDINCYSIIVSFSPLLYNLSFLFNRFPVFSNFTALINIMLWNMQCISFWVHNYHRLLRLRCGLMCHKLSSRIFENMHYLHSWSSVCLHALHSTLVISVENIRELLHGAHRVYPLFPYECLSAVVTFVLWCRSFHSLLSPPVFCSCI
jgi:hypothetical protein